MTLCAGRLEWRNLESAISQEAVNVMWASARSKRQLLCEEAHARA